MLMTKRNAAGCVLMGVSLLIGGLSSLTALAQPAPDGVKLDADTFPQLHKQIRPQPASRAGWSCPG